MSEGQAKEWLAERGLRVGDFKRGEWKRLPSPGGRQVVQVPAQSLRAYRRLPKIFRVNVTDVSPRFVDMRAREPTRMCFVEYQEQEIDSYQFRALDVSSKPEALKDPDYCNTGDLPTTFIGAFCSLWRGFLSRHVVSRTRIDCQALEVARGGIGRCRLVPTDNLAMEHDPEALDSALRRSLIESLNSLPLWVKEDQEHFFPLLTDLESKKRREKNYEKSVRECITRALERLEGGFADELEFSEVEEEEEEEEEEEDEEEQVDKEDEQREKANHGKHVRKPDFLGLEDMSSSIESSDNEDGVLVSPVAQKRAPEFLARIAASPPRQAKRSRDEESLVQQQNQNKDKKQKQKKPEKEAKSKKKKKAQQGDPETARLIKQLVELYVMDGEYEKDPVGALELALDEAKDMLRLLSRLKKRIRMVVENLDNEDPMFVDNMLELERLAQPRKRDDE